MSSTIVVIGATGTVGHLLVKDLTERKGEHKVVVVSRDVEKARKLYGDRVTIARGDVSDAKSIETVLTGADRLFFLTPSNAKQPELEAGLARIAKEKGVQHIVKLSVFGAGSQWPHDSLFRWHALAEDEVVKVGVPYTFLRPNLFMQNLLRDDAATIKNVNTLYRACGDYKISHVDVRDIAAMAAVILTEPIDNHAGRTYHVNGPASLNYQEFVQVISKVLGRPI